MDTYIVYKHTVPNGKVYIGITCTDPHMRWRGGKGYVHSDYFFQAILKYGWANISHTILHEGLSREEAEHLERELIEKYKSNDKRYGYNLMSGGGSSRHSEETKSKLSDFFKGKPWTVAMYESRGLKAPANAVVTPQRAKKKRATRPIYQLDDDYQIIKVWEGAYQIAKEIGFNRNNIVVACQTGRKRQNYYWKYVDND